MEISGQSEFIATTPAASCFLDISATGLVKVSFPSDAVTQAKLRKIRPRGMWCGVDQGWEFPLASAEELIRELGSRFSIKNDLVRWLAWLQEPLSPLPKYHELIARAELHNVLGDGRIPLLHQRIGSRWLISKRKALLGDEMGLGKTLTALLAARAMVRVDNSKVMVVAPIGLHAHWRSEAKALDLQIKLYSWAKLPRELFPEGTILVVDEAHFAQSFKSKRTKALLRLARHPRLRALWLLTGTPIRNGRPSQLYPLLAALDHPVARNKRKFEESFCQGYWRECGGYQVWDSSGSSRLEDLRQLLQPIMLRRTKQAVLRLPPKIRVEHDVTLEPLELIGFEHRLTLVVEEYRNRVKQGVVISEAESLVTLTALRQISAEYKLPTASRLIKQLLDQGYAIVLFSSFVKPLIFLQDFLGGELLTGKQTVAQRELAVDRFQAGDTALLLTTYGVGAFGFTLHRARHIILLERPWCPGDVSQAEDRCHRIGMDGSLTSHWLKLGFVDQLVDAMLTNKANIIDILTGERRFTNRRQSLTSMLTSCMHDS